MALLLDTHAFLWWLAGDRRLSRRARAAITSSETVFVSAASIWEIATKYRLGKLPGVEAIVNDLSAVIDMQEFTHLSITVVHAQRAGLLVGSHRDPFDRMLVAQARSEDLLLVSNEQLFDELGARRVW